MGGGEGAAAINPSKVALKLLQISAEPLQVAKPPRIDAQFALTGLDASPFRITQQTFPSGSAIPPMSHGEQPVSVPNIPSTLVG